MNPRFKYRVWYKPYNGYVEKRDHLVLLSDGILCEYDGIEIDSDNYIIEQCTGLKDKNGKLIYEGDVVMSPDGICYKIIWKKSCYFAKKLKTPNDIYYRPEPLLAQKFIEMRGFKITGNIHENKGE